MFQRGLEASTKCFLRVTTDVESRAQNVELRLPVILEEVCIFFVHTKFLLPLQSYLFITNQRVIHCTYICKYIKKK